MHPIKFDLYFCMTWIHLTTLWSCFLVSTVAPLVYCTTWKGLHRQAPWFANIWCHTMVIPRTLGWERVFQTQLLWFPRYDIMMIKCKITISFRIALYKKGTIQLSYNHFPSHLETTPTLIFIIKITKILVVGL